jgi:ribosomal protein S12
MSTMTQAMGLYKRVKKSPSSRTFKLRKHPQIAGSNWRVFYHSPKKPNSGKRRVAKIKIKQSTFVEITVDSQSHVVLD